MNSLPKKFIKTRLRVLCAAVSFTLASSPVLFSLTPNTVRAQALSIQVPYGLNGTPAWRENIALGVDIWLIAHESARRVLLLGRCTALDRTFPERPAPAMVTASTEVFKWMTGEAYTDLAPEPYSAATREVLPILVKHAFSAAELASWEALRNSPQGKRGLAIHEVEVALEKITDQLVDVSSGRYWSWPLARLNRLADAHNLGAEVDSVFDKLEAGSAVRLHEVSLVPGETKADDRFLERISQSGEILAEGFVKRLAPSDKEAYGRIAQVELLSRWLKITQALPRFAMGPAPGILRGQSVPATVSGFCDSVGLTSCQPDEEVHTAITKYRSAFTIAMRSNVPMDAARQIVRGIPSSGCQ